MEIAFIQDLGNRLQYLDESIMRDVGHRKILLQMLRTALILLRDFDCPPANLIQFGREVYLKDIWSGYVPRVPGFEPAINPLTWEWDDYSFKSDRT